MATNNWSTLNPAQLVPPGVNEIASVVATLSSTLSTALEVSKASLEAASALSASATSNPLESSLSAVIDEIKALISGLANTTTAHSIFIPIEKQQYGIGVDIPYVEIPEQDRLPPFVRLSEGVSVGIRSDDGFPEELVDFIESASSAVGGTRAFWKRLMLSMNDIGDEAIPSFGSTYAVCGVVVLFGAPELKGMLPQARLFQSLVAHNPRDILTGKIEPVTENVSTQTVVDALAGETGVLVRWDPVTTLQNPSNYSNEELIADEILVIRSTDPSFREKMSWDEVFPAQPNDDSSELPETDKTKVIARVINEGFANRYFDSADLEPGKTYYYATATRFTLDGERQPVGTISGVSRVNYDGRPDVSRRSTSPDWLATPSLIEMFPVLSGLLEQVTTALDGIADKATTDGGPSGIIDQALAQISQQIEVIESLSNDITGLTTQLNTLLSVNPGGIYTTTIYNTDGGIDKWMMDLARCFTDDSDPNRPPFDSTELVSGLVILAGAPGPAALTEFKALLDTFFGSSDSNPLLDAIQSVEQEVAVVEERAFDASLTSVPASSIPAPDAPTSVVFDATMRPVPQDVC